MRVCVDRGPALSNSTAQNSNTDCRRKWNLPLVPADEHESLALGAHLEQGVFHDLSEERLFYRISHVVLNLVVRVRERLVAADQAALRGEPVLDEEIWMLDDG